MKLRRIKVFFDGGCRPNPGRIEVAAVARGIAHVVEDLGHGTNHDAEWLALLHAFEISRSLGKASQIELVGDSLAVVREANAALTGENIATGHAATLIAMAAGGSPARIRWIKREQNLAGIALASRHPR